MQNYCRNHRTARSALILALVAALGTAGLARPVRDDSPATEAAPKAGRKKEKDQASEPNVIQTKRRDPFVVPIRVKHEPKVELKKEPKPVGPPNMESRLTDYRNLVRSMQTTGQAAPDKLSPYLIEELNVSGIFRTSAGYGAFVVAAPTKLTFFARPGMRTYDGVVKEVTPTGVKFVKHTRYDDGSVRQTEEFRALRSGK